MITQGWTTMTAGGIAYIVANTSNHWRKLFNVYAKFLFDYYQQTNRNIIADTTFPENWQAYRDHVLFQASSQEALLFSAPYFDATECIHIIAGKTYAASLNLPPLVWLDNYFAINTSARLIVSPYPDYRQLSNERIARLVELVASLDSPNQA